ncbi:MAG: SRPBCC family protein [Pseudonocardiales bacterium]|nr:SRPBCC family protein [Pseudonocardiales bacterium]MBV9729865.1 SRPBCC family protein [Pseudonocardiales bacterium]
MVHKQRIDIQVHTCAKATAVYALLRDGTSWPRWTSLDSFQLERAGEREPEGVGAIRIFRKGTVTGRDQITEVIPERRFSYRHLSGLPVRDYRADVDLEPTPEGTRIRWHISFAPKVPGTGWLCRWGIERFVKQCARGLAAYPLTTTLA